MRGDVLFWPSDGSPATRAICYFTHGPFCHVSADMGDGNDIGAHAEDGVRVRPVPSDRGLTKFSTLQFLMLQAGHKPGELVEDTPYRPAIEKGIAFLKRECGNKYGWCNIANSALKLLRIPYRVARLDRYDCSSLMTRYLMECGVEMDDLGEEPDSVSPNDLARWLGVITDNAAVVAAARAAGIK
jgi:hypothetical protein